ncbi:hypothetical protein [Formosa sp. A9]|uniref:hypothetical protein n=1 Tax=Formosa sp. A9 TaxID=3442641 RepID=UPI003EBE1A47
MKIDRNIYNFLPNLKDYKMIEAVDFLPEESNERYQTYRLTYQSVSLQQKTLYLQFDNIKQKASFGLWGDAYLKTIRLNNSKPE